MKTILTALITLMTLNTAALPSQPLGEPEKERIGTEKTSPMPLFIIENSEDSLFLRQNALKIETEDLKTEHFRTLCSRMLATVRDENNPGVGIAAPQVGISRRLIVVQRFDKPGEPFEIYVNPSIDEYGDDLALGQEGCLSIPGRSGIVKRSQTIVISYQEPSNGKHKREIVDGFTAVVFQHEIDHLNGILFIDREESNHEIINYTTEKSVCSQEIEIILKNDIIESVSFRGGCHGNTQGLSALLRGMPAQEAVARLKGIRCKDKLSSCPDQVARALSKT